MENNNESKNILKKRLLEYTKTVEYTSNRRIAITSNLLKIDLMSTFLSLILFVFEKKININKSYLYIIFSFILIINVIIFIALVLNSRNSRYINSSKFKVIKKYEKELFKNSFFDEEYKIYNKKMKNKKASKFSFIEIMLSSINFISIIYIIIFISII